MTFASGGAFTKFSHEFQTVCEPARMSFTCIDGKNIAINEEVLDEESLKQTWCQARRLEEVKASEVGNIFNFGTEKSEKMDFSFTNEKGEKQLVHLGSTA